MERSMKNDDGRFASMRALLLLVSGLVIWNCLGNSVTAAEKSGAELIVNGNMEEGNPPIGWTVSEATLSADTDCHSGKQSLKLFGLAHTGSTWQSFPIKPDTKYRLEFWYKCSEVGDLLVFVRVDSDLKIQERVSEDTWTRWTGEFATAKAHSPASTATMGFYVWWSDYALIDDVSITEIGPTETAAPVTTEAPVDAALAAKQKQAATDTLREKTLQSWQALFPKRKYICWAKSPWDKLRKINLPPAPVKECREINLAMGENEYESASFVLTNLSDQTAKFAISAKDAGIPVTLREAVWVTTYTGREVNDALPLLEGDLSIPPGESREVWLTLYSRGIEPGNYRPRITIKPRNMPSTSVDLRVKVYPVSLPDDKPIYTCYWDYLMPAWTTPEMAQALTDDMKKHYVNTTVVHPWPLRMQFDAGCLYCEKGKLKIDYTEVDRVLTTIANSIPR